MKPVSEKNPKSVYRLSYSLLVVLLLLTVGATFAFYKNAAEKDAVRFNATTSRMQTEIENKINLYITLLAGLRGFVQSTPNLKRSGFAAYSESLRLEENYPALRQIGYARTVTAANLPLYSEYLKSAGYSDFNLSLPPEKPVYQVVSFLEPQNPSAGQSIGSDLTTDPQQRSTMRLAEDTGAAAMSGRVQSPGEIGAGDAVIAIFLPVSGDDNVRAEGEVTGFVFTSLTADAFVRDIEKVQVEKDLAIELFDSSDGGDDLLASTADAGPIAAGLFSERRISTSEITVAGRRWILRYSSLSAFDQRSTVGWTPLLFISGILFSFLVFAFAYRDASRRDELQKLTTRLLVTQKEKQSLFEQEQQARLEAQEANLAKDEFLAIVSHELKTPLNTIAGWTTILKSDRNSQVTRETALRKIEKNLRLQAKIIEQILSFSQIMSDDARMSFRRVPASQIFVRAVETIRSSAAEKTIALETFNELNGELIDADADKIRLAFEQVLANAVKFTSSGGKIEARAVAKNGQVFFSVKDNGSGIDPEFLPHVFEQYKQADRPAVRSYGGLGLGLAITKHIVEMHGGSVRTESAGIGLGAQFTLTLPIKSEGKSV